MAATFSTMLWLIGAHAAFYSMPACLQSRLAEKEDRRIDRHGDPLTEEVSSEDVRCLLERWAGRAVAGRWLGSGWTGPGGGHAAVLVTARWPSSAVPARKCVMPCPPPKPHCQ